MYVYMEMQFANEKQGLQFNVKEVALVTAGKANPDLDRDFLLVRIGIHFQSTQYKADAMVSLPVQKWLHPQDGTSIIEILSDEAADADCVQGGRTLQQYIGWLQKGFDHEGMMPEREES